MKKLCKILMIIIFCVFLTAAVFAIKADAADITFAWDANTEPDLAGYTLHAGNTSGVYADSVAVGNVTTYTWTDIADGTWFFAATAQDAAGNQSGYSNEISMVIDTAAPGAPVNFTATIEANQVMIKTVPEQ